ncbi:MAG: metallophosphoesterase [Bacteroidetes bacterium]|jgi:Icc-related predicted phosphoesterase|nr:MAG: metallophosphoesterase [Bacteroidota bacterium]
MRIQYCSDLHLELEQNSRFLESNPLVVSGDILILAGDIVPLHDSYLNNPFFRFVTEHYKKVFWVPGNHEFYHSDMSAFGPSVNIPITENTSIVNNTMIQYNGIWFIFSTLWSKISSGKEKIIESKVQDFEMITIDANRFKVADFNRLHDNSLNFIKQKLAGFSGNVVVVTHHLPALVCNSEVHNESLINEAFCVDLTGFIESSSAGFWIHGHSHFNYHPKIIGNTIMLTNQLGYVQLNEGAGFRHNAYFSV